MISLREAMHAKMVACIVETRYDVMSILKVR